jgi:L-fuculose-phosphate aldolase
MADATDSKAILEEIVECAHTFYAKGLVEGTAGNISGRLPDDTVALTPSSTPYDDVTVANLAIVDLEGNQVGGDGAPSTEKSLHLECYRSYPEVKGVMHSHPRYASMFAVAREPIPAVIEEVVVYIGGEIPVCEYRTTGTDELGVEVARNLAERSVALMANHGMVAVGKSPDDALHASLVAERTAQIVWGARLLGEQHSVPEKVNSDFANVYKLIRETSW